MRGSLRVASRLGSGIVFTWLTLTGALGGRAAAQAAPTPTEGAGAPPAAGGATPASAGAPAAAAAPAPPVAIAQAVEPQRTAWNAIFGELLGRGLVYSINYERLLSEHVA